MSKVTEYIDNLFFLMPRPEAAAEMRLKLIESSEDKYEALLGWGKSEEEALGIVVSEFGSMEEICAELGVAPIGMNGNDTEMQLQQEFAAASKKLALGIASGVTVCVLHFILGRRFGRICHVPALGYRRRADRLFLDLLQPDEKADPDGYAPAPCAACGRQWTALGKKNRRCPLFADYAGRNRAVLPAGRIPGKVASGLGAVPSGRHPLRRYFDHSGRNREKVMFP